MRILILTDKGERHYRFANRIIEETGQVVGVITGAKRMERSVALPQKILRALKKGTLGAAVRNAFFHLLYADAGKALFAEKAQEEEKAFGGSKERFLSMHKDLLVAEVSAPHTSINDDHCVQLVRDLHPDVIVVMGTCLLGKKLIESAPLMLNIHTGLSPYYRGGYTNFWPIINGAFGYFGVTVHKMSLGIDAGEIAYTARPDVLPNDSYGSINCRCIELGIDLMIKALRHAEKNTLAFAPQWTEGLLFHNRDMNDYAAKQYWNTVRAFMTEYRKRAAEKNIDVVTVVENGVLSPSA